MAFVTIEDLRGSVETTLFADLYERSRGALAPGTVVEARGRVNVREDAEPKMVLTAIRPVPPPGEGGPIQVTLDFGPAGSSVSLEEIRSLLVRYPGESPVYFRVPGALGGTATTIRARRLLVSPTEDLLAALRERLGQNAVTVTGPAAAPDAGTAGDARPEVVPF
jgi:DNA polymerase III alpha subunit